MKAPLENNRVKKAIDNMVVNGGNVSKALRDADYSDAYSKNPQKFIATKQFKELADQYLPDDFLLGALYDDIEQKPKNRKAELELAFKVKGKMIDKKEVEHSGNFSLTSLFDSSTEDEVLEDNEE